MSELQILSFQHEFLSQICHMYLTDFCTKPFVAFSLISKKRQEERLREAQKGFLSLVNFWFRFAFILFCQFLLLLLLLCFPIQVFVIPEKRINQCMTVTEINELFIRVIQPRVRTQQTRGVALALAWPVRVRMRMLRLTASPPVLSRFGAWLGALGVVNWSSAWVQLMCLLNKRFWVDSDSIFCLCLDYQIIPVCLLLAHCSH